jgi:uncharacterized protein YegP (UPF0339 family)
MARFEVDIGIAGHSYTTKASAESRIAAVKCDTSNYTMHALLKFGLMA